MHYRPLIMRCPTILSIVAVCLTATCFQPEAQAQTTTLTSIANQGSGSYWSQSIWVTNAPGQYVNTTPKVAPVAGNFYELVNNGTVFAFGTSANGYTQPNTHIRNPTSTGSSQTFPSTLTLHTNTEIRFKKVTGIDPTNQTVTFPTWSGNPGLILNGGALDDGDNETLTILGSVQAASGSMSLLCPGANLGNRPTGLTLQGRTFVLGAVMAGDGALFVGLTPTNNPILITNGQNTFNGNWIIQEGWLIGTTPQCLGSASIRVDPQATLDAYPNLELEHYNNTDSGTGTNGAYAVLDFNYAPICTGTLILTNGGLMNLHTNCIFGNLSIEGTTLPNGTYTYSYLASHFTNFLAGGSGQITIATPVAPPVPTGLAAITGDGQETISWSVAATATGYIVSRSGSIAGPFTAVGSTNALAFKDTGLTDGQLYYYVVQATNAFGASAISTPVTAAPANPVSGVTMTGGVTGITLNWNSFGGATSYTVQRATIIDGVYSTIASGLTGITYTDTSVASGTRYYYMIVGNLSNGFSSAPSVAAGTVSYPAVPTVGAQLYGTNGILLQLSTTDAVLPQYSLKVSTDGINFSPLATVGSGTNYYLATNLTQGATYFFIAQAQNASGASANSAVAYKTVPIGAICVSFTDGNPANTSPVPPGYLSDIAFPYMDQGNGFTYGWNSDSANPASTGVDMTGQVHYNNNNPVGDLRRQVFISQTKGLFAPYPNWSIAIPNGLYQVHLVSFDATATDSTYQQNVNGVDTAIYVAGAANNAAEWTVLCSVTNNLLTLSPGINSTNDKINFIDIYHAQAPAAAFTRGPASGAAPLTVTFTNTSTGVYSSALWTFGDGGTSTSTSNVVTYTYIAAPATNTVSLMVTNSLGMVSTYTLTGAVVVTSAVTAPVAAFTMGRATGAAPLTVSFTNTSTGDYSAALWVFGDGGTSTSTNSVVTHSYTTAPATNTVSLTVTNSLGMFTTYTLSNAVIVTPPAPVSILFATSGTGSSLALQLSWTGGWPLLQATNITGPWVTNVGATSPFTVSPTNGKMFYRIKE